MFRRGHDDCVGGVASADRGDPEVVGGLGREHPGNVMPALIELAGGFRRDFLLIGPNAKTGASLLQSQRITGVGAAMLRDDAVGSVGHDPRFHRLCSKQPDVASPVD